MSKPQYPQKGPTRIDPKALQDLADKAGFDLVPKGRMAAFHVSQSADPLRVDRLDYRDAIRRSFVRQAADWLLQENAVSVLYGQDGIACTVSGTLIVVMPEPPPAPAPSSEEDPLS